MKIAYLHPHLKPGGVTTVISQQINAVFTDCESIVITGGQPPADFPAPHIRVDGLNYDDPCFPERTVKADETAKAIALAIYGRWPGGCDVLHVHNPLLAKNRQMLTILEILKNEGFNLFLQVHDLSEDGRPGLYYKNQAYPSDCHYATINSRDSQILIKSGLKPKGVHDLSNMVNPIDTSRVSQDAIESILYPVRGIRRKNIGEAILLSLFFPPSTPLAITLPPNSPGDWAVYNEWRDFAEKKALNILFEASAQYEFKALVARAKYLITTSITEGFGFTFLEPWTAGKALMGRKLPDICIDFEQKGINLTNLYENLFIPVEWVDGDALEKQYVLCVSETFASYGAKVSKADIYKGFRHVTRNRMIDFSVLDEPIQRRIITRLIDDVSAIMDLEQINPALAQFRSPPDVTPVISSNKDVISRQYSRGEYRKRLLDSYHRVKTIGIKHSIDRHILLAQFLKPEAFSLMKWCDNDLE